MMNNPNPAVSYYWTNASEAYDYYYVSTVARLPGCKWRLIAVRDQLRFDAFQQVRYLAGWHGCVRWDSPEAAALGLPPGTQQKGAMEWVTAQCHGEREAAT